jgi:hypothetical protein
MAARQATLEETGESDRCQGRNATSERDCAHAAKSGGNYVVAGLHLVQRDSGQLSRGLAAVPAPKPSDSSASTSVAR